MVKNDTTHKNASSQKNRQELIEENTVLYNEVLTARKAASITADLVVEQFAKMEKINKSLGEANAELLRVSSLDGLTGIANRGYHEKMLEREWRRCRRSHQSLSLIMVDIDHFKLFNDSYGHPAGDDCLRQVAQALQSVIHRAGDLVSRYGGEEFVYILPQSDIKASQAVAEKIRLAVAQLQIAHKTSETAPHITISLGISSLIPRQSMDPSFLIRAADQALYMAKEAGRNCFRYEQLFTKTG